MQWEGEWLKWCIMSKRMIMMRQLCLDKRERDSEAVNSNWSRSAWDGLSECEKEEKREMRR